MDKDTLYYDGHCPLCNAEIRRLRRLAGPGLQLRDIHELAQDPALPPRDQLLRRLHLRTRDDATLVGLEANIAAWEHTPFGGFWRWLRWPLVRPLAEIVYNRWALIRYRRLYGSDRSP